MGLSRFNINQLPYRGRKFLNAESLLAFDNDGSSLPQQKNVRLSSPSFMVGSPFAIQIGIAFPDLPASSRPTSTVQFWDILYSWFDGVRGFNVWLKSDQGSGVPQREFQVAVAFVDGSNSHVIESPSFKWEKSLKNLLINYDGTEVEIKVDRITSGYVALSGTIVNFTATDNAYIGDSFFDTGASRAWRGSFFLLRHFDKSLDRSEFDLLTRSPLSLVKGLHENCVREWLLNQRSYHKDIANQYALGANSVLVFDSSYQYNYAKENPINSAHGVMTGWSDAEVVIFPEPTSVKDFYDPSVSADWTSDGGDTEIESGLLPITKAFHCSVENMRARVSSFGDFIGAGDLTFMCTVKVDASGGNAFRNYLKLSTYQIARTTNANNKIAVNAEGSTFLRDEAVLITVFVTRKNGLQQGFVSYGLDYEAQEINGLTSPIDLTGELLNIGEGVNGNCHFIRCGVWSRGLSQHEMIHLHNNGGLSNPKGDQTDDLEGYYLCDAFDDSGTAKLRDHSGNDRHAEMTLLSGATGADKVDTFNNQLVDINTLM